MPEDKNNQQNYMSVWVKGVRYNNVNSIPDEKKKTLNVDFSNTDMSESEEWKADLSKAVVPTPDNKE